jgi:hypothetical protein
MAFSPAIKRPRHEAGQLLPSSLLVGSEILRRRSQGGGTVQCCNWRVILFTKVLPCVNDLFWNVMPCSLILVEHCERSEKPDDYVFTLLPWKQRATESFFLLAKFNRTARRSHRQRLANIKSCFACPSNRHTKARMVNTDLIYSANTKCLCSGIIVKSVNTRCLYGGIILNHSLVTPYFGVPSHQNFEKSVNLRQLICNKIYDEVMVSNKPIPIRDCVWTLSLIEFSKQHCRKQGFLVQKSNNPELHTTFRTF